MRKLKDVSRSYSLTRCIICNRALQGRKDKKFCSLKCKNIYRDIRLAQNEEATDVIDKKLHRNRTILLELSDEAKSIKWICPRNRLERKGFSFKHCTSTSENKEGKMYYHLYEFSWMEFSTTDILIVRKPVEKANT